MEQSNNQIRKNVFFFQWLLKNIQYTFLSKSNKNFEVHVFTGIWVFQTNTFLNKQPISNTILHVPCIEMIPILVLHYHVDLKIFLTDYGQVSQSILSAKLNTLKIPKTYVDLVTQ